MSAKGGTVGQKCGRRILKPDRSHVEVCCIDRRAEWSWDSCWRRPSITNPLPRSRAAQTTPLAESPSSLNRTLGNGGQGAKRADFSGLTSPRHSSSASDTHPALGGPAHGRGRLVMRENSRVRPRVAVPQPGWPQLRGGRRGEISDAILCRRRHTSRCLASSPSFHCGVVAAATRTPYLWEIADFPNFRCTLFAGQLGILRGEGVREASSKHHGKVHVMIQLGKSGWLRCVIPVPDALCTDQEREVGHRQAGLPHPALTALCVFHIGNC